MRRAREEEFRQKLARMVHSVRPDWCARESGGAATIASRLIRQSLSHGLFLDEDVVRFALFVLRYGPDFSEHPEMHWANLILNDSSLVGSQKLDRLEMELLSR